MSHSQWDSLILVIHVSERQIKVGFSSTDNSNFRIQRLWLGRWLRSIKICENPGCRHFNHVKEERKGGLNVPEVMKGAWEYNRSYFSHSFIIWKKKLLPKRFPSDRTTLKRKVVSIFRKWYHTPDDMWRRERDVYHPHRTVKLGHICGAKTLLSVWISGFWGQAMCFGPLDAGAEFNDPDCSCSCVGLGSWGLLIFGKRFSPLW